MFIQTALNLDNPYVIKSQKVTKPVNKTLGLIENLVINSNSVKAFAKNCKTPVRKLMLDLLLNYINTVKTPINFYKDYCPVRPALTYQYNVNINFNAPQLELIDYFIKRHGWSYTDLINNMMIHNQLIGRFYVGLNKNFFDLSQIMVDSEKQTIVKLTPLTQEEIHKLTSKKPPSTKPIIGNEDKELMSLLSTLGNRCLDIAHSIQNGEVDSQFSSLLKMVYDKKTGELVLKIKG